MIMFIQAVMVKCSLCGRTSRFDSREEAEEQLQEVPMYVERAGCTLCAYCASCAEFNEAKQALLDYAAAGIPDEFIDGVLKAARVPKEELKDYKNRLRAAINFTSAFESSLLQSIYRVVDREVEAKADFHVS